MGYVEGVLQQGEQVIARAHLHWVIYVVPLLLALAALAIFIAALADPGASPLLDILAALFFLAAVITAARAWFDQWITEIAVTNLRVIHKEGFIRRRTEEMNMEKVESVRVDQSLLGRLLDYGTINVLGTGEGMTHLKQVASPIKLRNAIIAR